MGFCKGLLVLAGFIISCWVILLCLKRILDPSGEAPPTRDGHKPAPAEMAYFRQEAREAIAKRRWENFLGLNRKGILSEEEIRLIRIITKFREYGSTPRSIPKLIGFFNSARDQTDSELRMTEKLIRSQSKLLFVPEEQKKRAGDFLELLKKRREAIVKILLEIKQIAREQQ